MGTGTGRMWAQNGNLELGNFEPQHFSISTIRPPKIYECFRFPDHTKVYAPTLNILLWIMSQMLSNLLKNGGRCTEKCNFYMKYFDKMKCYADRPYRFFSELKPETHISLFLALYTHINHIIKKINFSNSKKFARDYISTNTNTRARLYAIPIRTHGRTDEWTDVIITADSYFFNAGVNKT